LVFAGHTDVVPPGPREAWSSDPFVPTERDGVLYGRGAADMKSGISAMLVAVERLLKAQPEWPAQMAFLITSDEEGPCRHGTRYVAQVLGQRGIQPNYVIVGEATAVDQVGDRFIVGRRGSLGGSLSILGVQGHVAYPERAENPIHRVLPALQELTSRRWDQGTEAFPATSLQISNFHAGTGVSNVIPGQAQIEFNFRYSPAVTAKMLQDAVHAALDAEQLRYTLEWSHSGEPYYTAPGVLRRTTAELLRVHRGSQAEEFTGGGTSDGRFLAPLGCEVIELGPVARSIHKIDEHIRLADLDILVDLYQELLLRLPGAHSA
jgi:succinyl-diaminopimelate desuccinylase